MHTQVGGVFFFGDQLILLMLFCGGIGPLSVHSNAHLFCAIHSGPGAGAVVTYECCFAGDGATLDIQPYCT